MRYKNLNAIIAFKCKNMNAILNAVAQIQRNFEKVGQIKKGLKQPKKV